MEHTYTRDKSKRQWHISKNGAFKGLCGVLIDNDTRQVRDVLDAPCCICRGCTSAAVLLLEKTMHEFANFERFGA